LDLLVAVAFDREFRLASSALHALPAPHRAAPWAQCTPAGRKVAVVQLGVGPKSSAKTLQLVLDEVAPERVLVVGVAGGLDPSLRPGALLLADRLTADGCEAFDVPLDFHRPAGAVVGPIHSVDQVVCTPAAKAAMHRATSALAVDMESYAVAQTCRTQGIPCSVWRAVADPAQASLLNILGKALREDGSIHLPTALATIAVRPHHWSQVLRTRRDANAALAALDAALAGLLGVWNRAPKAGP
jgi:nucleoside phosphorylase